jgi:1,4-alpha-glucan branching enzyme
MNVVLGPMIAAAHLGGNDLAGVRWAVDTAPGTSDANLRNTVQGALARVFGAFALLMTSVGMPMFLAGEEFADIHDMDPFGVNPKQEDPVQWQRSLYPDHAALRAAVGRLIQLRTSHAALQRNEVAFFYFHPQFDDNNAPRVFAYCRTGGRSAGSTNQVIVIANMGGANFPNYDIPNWPWGSLPLTEIGGIFPAAAPSFNAGLLSLALPPFSARVFRA